MIEDQSNKLTEDMINTSKCKAIGTVTRKRERRQKMTPTIGMVATSGGGGGVYIIAVVMSMI